MSTTQTKRNIIDFLWEWAENYNLWGKLLVSKIVNKESPLLKEERNEIYNCFLTDIGLADSEGTLEINRPSFDYSGKSIFLKSLHI